MIARSFMRVASRIIVLNFPLLLLLLQLSSQNGLIHVKIKLFESFYRWFYFLFVILHLVYRNSRIRRIKSIFLIGLICFYGSFGWILGVDYCVDPFDHWGWCDWLIIHTSGGIINLKFILTIKLGIKQIFRTLHHILLLSELINEVLFWVLIALRRLDFDAISIKSCLGSNCSQRSLTVCHSSLPWHLFLLLRRINIGRIDDLVSIVHGRLIVLNNGWILKNLTIS